MTSTLTVGELARASGVAVSAVRFYEKHGLITSERTHGNQRRFHPTNVCLIKIVRVAQRVGLTVAEIRTHLTSLPTNPTPTDFHHIRLRLETEAHTRIQSLTQVLNDLATGQELCQVPPKNKTSQGEVADNYRLHDLPA
jgi:MerR family transcriptional regulator, redox-sensitive transcriptional activator SoxR